MLFSLVLLIIHLLRTSLLISSLSCGWKSSKSSVSFKLSSQSTSQDVIYDLIDNSLFDKVEDKYKYFREYTKRGMKRMKENNLDGALMDFNRALNTNTSQPLVQRAIVLYLLGDYDEAEKQFDHDLLLFEGEKTVKASDLRLWRSACFRHLNQESQAKRAISMYLPQEGLPETRYLMNVTLEFYAGQRELIDVIEIMENAPEKDLAG